MSGSTTYARAVLAALGLCRRRGGRAAQRERDPQQLEGVVLSGPIRGACTRRRSLSVKRGARLISKSKKKDAETQRKKATKYKEEAGDCRQAYVWIDSPPSIVLCGVSFPIRCALPMRNVPPLGVFSSGSSLIADVHDPYSLEKHPTCIIQNLSGFSGFFVRKKLT